MPRVRHSLAKPASEPAKTSSEPAKTSSEPAKTSSEPTASPSTSQENSEDMEKALKTAIRQRAQVSAKLQRIEYTLQETKEPTVSQLKVLAKTIATIYTEFSALHTTIAVVTSIREVNSLDPSSRHEEGRCT
ncbi:uncharacterized protein LOC101736841 [Anopheles sinensis]|uniref:Uncharacterized protein LOC101736841 n=1 Tax=Anopheles sinensis TaxID=74873 RepID=A0A084WCM0_ANOSI|nr:uncharacterized protein LOC101736841 [Anopheles sinensis]